MTAYVALLRAVNVGGTGKLPMADLKAMAEELGFEQVRTYIASGNLVFDSGLSEGEVRAALEARLERYAGKPIGVHVRTGAEMAAVLAANPFKDTAPNRTMAIFLDAPPPADWKDRITGRADEDYESEGRELFVHYGQGMGTSKLKIPAARTGTARNLNTVAKLAEMAAS